MSKLIDKIKTIPEKRIGYITKRLCCNCLGEEFVSDAKTFWKCLICGDMNPQTIRIVITYWEYTGHEL